MAIRPQQKAAIANGLGMGGAQFFPPVGGGGMGGGPAPALSVQARAANPTITPRIMPTPPPPPMPGGTVPPPVTPPVRPPGTTSSTGVPWYGAIPRDVRNDPRLDTGGTGYNPTPGGKPLYDPNKVLNPPEALPGGGSAGDPDNGTHTVQTTNGPVEVPNDAKVGSGGFASQVWNAADLLGLTGNGGTGGSGTPPPAPTLNPDETLPGGGYTGTPDSGTHSVDTTNGPVDVPNNAQVGSGGLNSQVWNAADILGLTGGGGNATPTNPVTSAPVAPPVPPPATGGSGFGGGLGQAIDKLGLGGSPAPAPDPVSNVAAALSAPPTPQPPAAPPPSPPASSGGGGFSGGLGQAIDKLGLGGTPAPPVAPTPPPVEAPPPFVSNPAPPPAPVDPPNPYTGSLQQALTGRTGFEQAAVPPTNQVDQIASALSEPPQQPSSPLVAAPPPPVAASAPVEPAPPPPTPFISNPTPPPAPAPTYDPVAANLQQALTGRTGYENMPGAPTQPTGDQIAAIVGGLAPPPVPFVEPPPPLYINNPLGMRR